MATSLEYARQVLALHRDELLSLPFVQSVQTSILDGDAVILVFLTRRLQAGEYLPNMLEGVRVVPRVTGLIQSMVADHTARYRPAIGGISVGNPDIGAGTLGAIIYLNNEPYIASNLHVLGTYERAKKGIPTLQPGVADGAEEPDDIIGHLDWWQKIGSNNVIDFALSKPLDNTLVEQRILETDGYEVFPAEVEIGQEVKKSGRSTGLTVGNVIATDASCKIGGTNFSFHDLILVEGNNICLPGDSGSAVLYDHNLAGFLFAGPSEPPYDHYFACKATNVEKALLSTGQKAEWVLPMISLTLAIIIPLLSPLTKTSGNETLY